MNTPQLLLIDLSAIAHQIWHVSGNQPDPSYVGNELVGRVRALATEHPHAAVCCDSGKSFRADLDPTYKAQRDTDNRAPLKHQMGVACDRLAKDGFPIWRVPRFEADDLIATATAEALKIDGATVLIASSDKDLLQLVNDRVSVKSLIDGNVRGPADVFDKFGVQPDQMGDLLALMGDTSDNIKGADKIGKVIGARLLSEHGTLAALYEKMAQGVVSGVTPGMRTSLLEFQPRWPLVASLIALRQDAPIPFHEIAVERAAPPMEEETEMDKHERFNEVMRAASAPSPEPVPFEKGNDANGSGLSFAPVNTPAQDAINAQVKQRETERKAQFDNVVPYVQPLPVVAEFSQQLEPRSLDEAAKLAGHMFAAKLFNAYGTWQGVFSTILAGRELGLPAMASLRAFHIIESRPQLSADTIAALVLKSGKAKYFKCTGRSATAATFKTLRLGDDEEPLELVYTIEEARQAWKKDEKAWNNSSWGTNPADMLVARAKSKLARLVYPDVVGGLYAMEEME